MVNEAIKNQQKDYKVKDDVICYSPIVSTKEEVWSQKATTSRMPKEESFYNIKRFTLKR